MTQKNKPQRHFGCSCCNANIVSNRRSFLLGGAALGVAGAGAFLAAPTGARAQGAAASPRGGNFVLRGGYVITMDGPLGDIPIGDVHIRDGAIVAVAPSIEAPGAEIVDARGMIVMPGFIETHSHVWNALLKNMRRPGVDYFPLKEAFGRGVSVLHARLVAKLQEFVAVDRIAGGNEAVPPQYKDLVERYLRALSAGGTK